MIKRLNDVIFEHVVSIQDSNKVLINYKHEQVITTKLLRCI